MTTTLREQARQGGLVLLDETPEWNENDWPPLQGGCRDRHATVVLNHSDNDDNYNNMGQTVVVMGGYQSGQGEFDSVLVLNLAESNKQWREGPTLNKKRDGHASVVCNGGVYVMGGDNARSRLDSIEQIDANDLLQASFTNSTTHESHWTTLTCRLSTGRFGCCAVAVHNRYIVVVGGLTDCCLSSVDIIDTHNHAVTAGPSMTVPRLFCGSAVIGHRIFVVGGRNEHGNLDSVEYIDFAMPCDNEKPKEEMAPTVISFSSRWTTHSDLVLSNARSSCAVVAVGSCLVVVGGLHNPTVEVLDTSRNRLWNLPPFGNDRYCCSMVTLADQIAVIGGWGCPSCVTLPLLDKNSWCFCRLSEQHPNGWYQFREGMGIRDVNATSCSISTSNRKRVKTDP